MEYSSLSGQYHLEKTIGCGGFAKVKLATHILTGEKVAIKIMQKQALMEDLPRVKHEINALKSLSHTNICKLYQIVETNTHYFLIMEYCCGGELFDHIVEKEKLTEDEARLFFQQIVSAVSFLHSQGFAHRDLKPENILLDKKHNLKLIDFGLSVKPENGLEECLYTSCGSPNYAAPELIRGEKYLGHEIDIWSLGVLLYALLCGSLPFEDASIQKLYGKILSGNYEEKEWLSSESKSLLSSLLQVNARKRISTTKLKAHPWFKKAFGGIDVGHSVAKLTKDEEILHFMAQHFNMPPEDLWNDIKKEKYDYTMATYLILQGKKQANEPFVVQYDITPRKKILGNCLKQGIGKVRNSHGNTDDNAGMKKTETYVVRRDGEGIRGSSKCDENRLSGRRNCKRIRSPGIGDRTGPEAKRLKESKTPILKKQPSQNNITPCSAKKILVGLEKSLNKAKSALTPRLKNNSTESTQPAILWGKNLCNVSSTTSQSPEDVLARLKNALDAKGIICTQKGFILKGKLRQPSSDKRKGKSQEDKLSFELEVCWIPCLSNSMKSFSRKAMDSLKGAVVGIRRKRLRGDAWIYKNICEEVLALASPHKKK